MATPVVTIEVDDRKFKEFVKEYDAQVARMSKTVVPISPSLGGSGGNQGGVSGMASFFQKQHQLQGKTLQQVGAIGNAWNRVSGTVNGIGKSLTATFMTLGRFLPMLGITAAGIGGIAGLPAALLMGFSKFLGGVSENRTRNLKSSMSEGQRRSFNNAYKDLGLDEGTVTSVANLKDDKTQWGKLLTALQPYGSKAFGMAESMNAADLTQAIFKGINQSKSVELANMSGAAIGLGPEQVRMIRALSAGELDKRRGEYGKNINRFEQEAAAQEKAQENLRRFNALLETANMKIQQVLLTYGLPVFERFVVWVDKAVTIVEQNWVPMMDKMTERMAPFISMYESLVRVLQPVIDVVSVLAVPLLKLKEQVDRLNISLINALMQVVENIAYRINDYLKGFLKALVPEPLRKKFEGWLSDAPKNIGNLATAVGSATEAIDGMAATIEAENKVRNTALVNERRAMMNIPTTAGSAAPKSGKSLRGTSDTTGSAAPNSGNSLAGANQAMMARALYEESRKLGWSHNASTALVGEIGRENSLNPNTMFGTHIDPKNGARNGGLISWQKERYDQLHAFLKSKGIKVSADGKIEQTRDAMRAQLEFLQKEMETNARYSNARNAMLSAGSVEDIQDALGRDYIKWRIDDPKFRSGGLANRRKFADMVRGFGNMGTTSNSIGVPANDAPYTAPTTIVIQNQTGNNLNMNAGMRARGR